MNSFFLVRPIIVVCYLSLTIANEILMSIRGAKKHQAEQYLQEPVGIDKEGNEVTLQDKVADDSDCIDDQVSLKMQIKTLYEEMKRNLADRELSIIKMRYGLIDGYEKTQREIAKELDISRSYVSRIEKKALAKLLKAMNK